MDVTLLGLGTCDTCRKARSALIAEVHSVQFRDVRKEPLSPDEIRNLLDEIGAELVNRRSTTWRQLPEEEQALFETTDGQLSLLAAHPSLMKRPVIWHASKTIAGWKSGWMASISG